MIDNIADKLRQRAAEQLIGLPETEVINWKEHPITLYLIKTLEADKLDIMEAWGNGQFLAESSEGTSQKNAKALGMLESVDLTLSAISELHSLTEEEFENDYTNGT
jgi:hypothetical protein